MYIDFEKMDPKIAFTNMLCNGVIMDVMNVEQARIAEDAGAAAVMALERVPALIIREGGIARASDPLMIKKIQEAVSIPVMAKCRIAPIRKLSTLQMKLNAAVLSARGRKVIEKEMRFQFEKVFHLVDSETVYTYSPFPAALRQGDFYMEGLAQIVVADSNALLSTALEGLERVSQTDRVSGPYTRQGLECSRAVTNHAHW